MSETTPTNIRTDKTPPRPRGRRTKRELKQTGFKQIAMIWFYVSSLDESVKFYRSKFGLRLLFLDEDTGWAIFETGAEGVDLGLCIWPHGGTVPRGGGGCPMFDVVDLTAFRINLEERGVVFDGEIVGREGERRHTTFHDPDGNPIQLTQNW
jgi:catechol 2,3-dioxygenase-like lactoylglutathione lyase family enzyme